MGNKETAKEIVRAIEKAGGGEIKSCAYCSYPSICLTGGGYGCPDRNRWLNQLEAEIEEYLDKKHETR